MEPAQMDRARTTRQPDLRELVYRGSTWLVAGTVSQRAVRLLSNLVLTRLLFAEDFGLVALVFAWVQGLILCSDLGVVRSLIQNPKGDSDAFLGTAFTLNIIRAATLCLVSLLIAIPMANFYEMPELRAMLPVASLSVLIGSFQSPRMVLLVRNLQIRKTESFSIASSLAGLIFTLTLAVVWGSAWALVVGSLCRDTFKCILSYLVCPPRGIWPRWDSGAFREILSFGRWILLSSFFTFLALQADRLIAGKFVSPGVLGHLSVALLFTGMVRSLVSRGQRNILMPIFSRTTGSAPERLLPRYRMARLGMLAVLLPVLCGLALFGPELIALLYEDRWFAVGFYLQCSVVGFLPAYILTGTGVALLAVGDSKGNAQVTAVDVVAQVGLMLFGVLNWGLPGMLVARGLATVISYPVLAIRLRRCGLWLPWLDLGALVATGLLFALGLYCKRVFLS